MSFDQLVSCPNCQHQFSVTSTLSAQIRQELEKENALKRASEEKHLQLKQRQLDEAAQKLKSQEASLDSKAKEIAEKYKQEQWTLAQQKAAEKFEQKIKEDEEEKEKMAERLKLAEENELKFLKQKRDLEEKERRFEIEKARQIEEERRKIVEEAKKAADEDSRLKMAEKDKQMMMMRQQIDELKRKSEQGSMQIQGEVQEDDLKALLMTNFPTDEVRDVEKGIRGADLIQIVRNSFGQQCGIIVYESKNTSAWKDEWVTKLRDDQHLAKADICVLVTKILPKGVENKYKIVNGVWVIHPSVVIILVHALRAQLQQVHYVKQSSVGKEEKMELLYNYLSGSQFKSRVENIVTAFISLQEQLATEKRAMSKIWAHREKDIQRIIDQTTAMHGDLKSLLGGALPELKQLELGDGLFD